MYWSAHDNVQQMAVWVMDGPSVSTAEWDRHFADITRVAGWGREGGKHPVVMLFIGRLFLPPDALRRRQIAEATSAPGYNCALGIVTPNLLMRSVMTAIRWVRGAKPDAHPSEFFAEAAAAFRWLEGKRGEPMPGFKSLLRGAPAEVVGELAAW